MTLTIQQLQVTGPASAAGTVLGSQVLAAPASWTRLTTLGTIPSGGSVIKASSDAEPFRIALIDPRSSLDTAAADYTPPHNGVLVPWFGAYFILEDVEAGPGTQVWVKQA